MKLTRARFAILGCVLSCTAVAHADAPPGGAKKSEPSADAAMAQSLFEKGRAQMQRGEHSEACATFEESNRLDPSAGTLLNLGKCHELIGRTASAWAAFEQAIVIGRAKGQTRHVEAGEQYAAEIEPHVPKLIISATRAIPGLKIYRDGTEIAEAARETPIAIDPGPHYIRAEAPGYQPWLRTITVEKDATVNVQVPDLLPAVRNPGNALPYEPITQSPAETSPPAMELFIAGLAVGGVGVICLGAGTGFGIATLNDASEARDDEDLCPDGRCTEAGWAHVEDAETKATASTALLAGGGILTAAGVALGVAGFMIGQKKDIAVNPVLSPRFAGFVFEGPL